MALSLPYALLMQSLKIKILFLLALLLLLPGSLYAASTEAVTLSQCYEWAKSRNEDLKIRQEDIRQSQARARAAIGNAYPDLRWKLTDTWQDPDGVDKLEAQGFSGFVEKEQVDSRFSLQQPIFSGLREFSAMSAYKRETTRNSLLFEKASLALFERTANAFYDVVEFETNQANTLASLELAQERVKELRSDLRLGKARESEVFSAKAQAAALKAQVDEIQGDIQSARQELSFLTGEDLTAAPLQDEIPSPPTFVSLEEASAKVKERSDLRAQREDAAGKKLLIRYQRGYYWPTVDVTGNYYTRRPTFMDEIDWDVVLAVEVPIFQGGIVKSNVKEAVSSYQQSNLVLQQMERRVAHDVHKTYGDLTSAIQEAQSYDEAAQAAQKSYEVLRKEYRLGLATNLEVLQALDLMQTQKTSRDTARLKVKRLYLQLNVMMEKTL